MGGVHKRQIASFCKDSQTLAMFRNEAIRRLTISRTGCRDPAALSHTFFARLLPRDPVKGGGELLVPRLPRSGTADIGVGGLMGGGGAVDIQRGNPMATEVLQGRPLLQVVHGSHISSDVRDFIAPRGFSRSQLRMPEFFRKWRSSRS